MKYHTFHEDGSHPVLTDTIFVFGSNLAGRHGAGAAKWAMKHRGAVYGEGIGLYGNSYAIPTKDLLIETLPVNQIIRYINEFKRLTHVMNDRDFFITRVGCGLAGYDDETIAPLFRGCNPSNCSFPDKWEEFLNGD